MIWEQEVEALLTAEVRQIGAEENLLRRIRADPEPLRRAQGLLLLHLRLLDVSNEAMTDLNHARSVFAANGRDEEEVQCLQAQVNLLRSRGAAQCAFAMVRYALDRRSLSVDTRTGLAYQGLHALTMLLRYDEAEAWAQRYLLPVLEGQQGVPRRFDWWLGLGYLRAQQFSRAQGHVTAATLDLDPERSAQPQLAKMRLTQAEDCLAAALQLVENATQAQLAQIFEMVVAGCRGDTQRLSMLHGAIDTQLDGNISPTRVGARLNFGLLMQCNGNLDEAHHALHDACQMARSLDARGLLHMALFSLGRVALLRGHGEAAARCYQEFLQLQLELRRQSESWFPDPADRLLYGPRACPLPLHPNQLVAVKPPVIRRAAQIIQSNLADPPKVTELAAVLGVSVRNLEQLMKRYEGDTPVAFVRRLRMTRARELVEFTALPIRDVAKTLGYQHLSSFVRDFRKTFGMSPSVVRSKK